MPSVGLHHKTNKLFRSRLLLLRVTLALACLAGFLLSAKLWLASRSYPLTPVFEWLPAVPEPVDRLWFGSLCLLLAVIVVARRSRKYLLAFVVLAGVLSLFDQSRWQPWFYQYLFMFMALAVYPWGEQNLEKRELALNICRFIIASTYLWSGLQKLNASFVEDLFPWLVEPLVALLPGASEQLVHPLGITVPFIEASIGIGLLTRFRNVAIILALSMHAFILFSIGWFGHDWNTVVWPWNFAMMVFVVILFWRPEGFSARDVLIPRTSLLHGLVLLLFGVMPMFSFFGLWDSYLSMSLYSSNTKNAVLYVNKAAEDSLPETMREFAVKSEVNSANTRISITRWSWEDLNVPAYPESRVLQNVAKHVCEEAGDPSGIRLVVNGKPAPVDGSREADIYDCSMLGTR